MKCFAKTLSLIATGTMAVLLLDGCFLQTAAIHYTPQTNVAPVAGADRVPVKLEVVDARLLRDRVGEVHSLFSSPVVTDDDPVLILKQAVKEELVHRGFNLSDAGVDLQVQLKSIYCEFRPEGEPHGARAKTAITVIIRNSAGAVLYNNLFTGEADVPNFGSRANAGIALDNSLQNCLARLFGNPAFVNALVNASGSTQNTD